MSKVTNPSALPSEMEDKLRSIRRRQAWLTVLRSVAIGASVLMFAMVVAMLVDWWLTLFSTEIRVVLTFGSLALAVFALAATGIPPLIAALRLTRAASNADHQVPQLEERWTTVASFANSPHQPTNETAKAMLQQVTSEAVAMGRLVQPARVARPTVLRSAGLMLGASTLVLAGFLAINWDHTSVLLKRFWSPTADITATRLKSLTGDAEIPRGESIDLVAELTGLPRDTAILELATGPEIVDTFELTPDDDHANTFVHPTHADESFRYRVRAGDGRTPWHSITVIDYPAFGEVKLTVTPPDYVDRPTYEKTLIPRRIKVVQGSRLELLMKPVTPLERLELALTVDANDDDSEPVKQILTLAPDRNGWYRFDSQLVEDVLLSPTLFSSHGLTNEDKHACRIQVIADKAPVARIITPTDEMAVAVDDVIPIKFEAHDDHGIASAELVVYDESSVAEGEEPKILSVQQIPLGEQRLEKHVAAETELDLRKLNLAEGTNISYVIRVTDNRMMQLDPQATLAQMAQAKSGESDDDTQMAQAGDPQPANDSGPQEDRQRGDRQPTTPQDDIESMLADAGDRVDQESRDAGAANRDTDGNDSPNRNNKAQPASADSPNDNDSGRDRSDDSRGDDRNGDPIASQTPTPTDQTGQERDADDPAEPADGTNDDRDSSHETSPAKASSDNREPDDNDARPDEDDGTAVASNTGRNRTGTPPSGAGGTTQRDDDNPAPSNNRGMTDNNGDRPRSANANDDSENRDAADNPRLADTTEPQRNAENAQRMLAQSGPAAGGNNRNTNNRNTNNPNSAGGTRQANASKQQPNRNGSSQQSPPRDKQVVMNPQRTNSGQNTTTKRRGLKITERLSAVAAATERKAENMQIRDRVVQIDRMLAKAEQSLTKVVDREIPDADRSQQFTLIDRQLGDIDTYIAELRKETTDHQFAFVGLQMVHIGRTHVTPARDRVFNAIREPLGTDNPTVALHHIVRAREMLAGLLKRYDRVARDQELAKALDESVKMYEVYVEKMQQLMRERRQNRNPLQRKMAVVEVDQEYLDRYAEVLGLRREMMAELGRMLGDDPRLLSRYLDLIRRRQSSLRDRLSDLFEHQDEITAELSGWLQAGDQHREDVWSIVAEMRLHAATPLAKEADELAERIEQTMPLVLKTDEGTAARIIGDARKIAELARRISFDATKGQQRSDPSGASPDLVTHSERLVVLFGELDAALEQLNFEHEGVDDVATYVDGRLLESRTVADRADEWAQTARHVGSKQYHRLAEIDQQTVAVATELLRIEMLGIEDELDGQFQQVAESEMPSEIVDMIRELHHVMEAITFNQAAATFAMSQDRLESAEVQQAKAVQGFERAEKLFDRIRRAVVAELDEYDVRNPNVADLRDPTLDDFLARLEREPNIEAQLGIPQRRRNIRVLADTMTWRRQGGAMLGGSGAAARQRARLAMRMQQGGGKPQKPGTPKREMTDEEREQLAQAKDMKEMLARSLDSLRQKANDPNTPPEQRRRLEEMARNMQRILDQTGGHNPDDQEWTQIAEAAKVQDILRAMARGEDLPDEQWNKLLSTLDDGLWQVRGRTPPEDYRKAIEQYQERIRQLMNTVDAGAE